MSRDQRKVLLTRALQGGLNEYPTQTHNYRPVVRTTSVCCSALPNSKIVLETPSVKSGSNQENKYRWGDARFDFCGRIRRHDDNGGGEKGRLEQLEDGTR